MFDIFYFKSITLFFIYNTTSKNLYSKFINHELSEKSMLVLYLTCNNNLKKRLHCVMMV